MPSSFGSGFDTNNNAVSLVSQFNNTGRSYWRPFIVSNFLGFLISIFVKCVIKYRGVL